jgi:dTDP-4-amino-4,6-dideoxygalactose transaminase
LVSATRSANIPLLDLRAEYHEHRDEILAAIASVLEEMHLYRGPNVRALEEEFAAYCGTRHAVGVGSGTEALLLAYMAAGIGPGHEVIVPSHTFIATVAPIAFLGARPVFVDIDPVTYALDAAEVEAAVTARTRAVVPVHLYGHPAHMEPLRAVARRHGLLLIEDACQAVGAEYDGRRAGSLGDIGCFSFVFTKNLKAYGDAGMITTDDDELARKARLLRDHGRIDKHQHQVLGLNCRLDEIQAAIVRVQLRYQEERTEGRRRIARRYTETLAASSLATPVERPRARHVYHQYVLRTPHRAALAHWLEERGVSTGIHYPLPCHLQPACVRFGFGEGSLPITERVVREIISIPVYPELEEEQIQRIIDALTEFDSTWGRAEPERNSACVP